MNEEVRFGRMMVLKWRGKCPSRERMTRKEEEEEEERVVWEVNVLCVCGVEGRKGE